jgi:hypothetical protein
VELSVIGWLPVVTMENWKSSRTLPVASAGEVIAGGDAVMVTVTMPGWGRRARRWR